MSVSEVLHDLSAYIYCTRTIAFFTKISSASQSPNTFSTYASLLDVVPRLHSAIVVHHRWGLVLARLYTWHTSKHGHDIYSAYCDLHVHKKEAKKCSIVLTTT